MNGMSFNWFEPSSHVPIKICVSDKLGTLLPHSHGETELMYFYRADNCRYLCGGKTITCSSRDALIINPGEIHSCTSWGENCIAACLVINTAMLPAMSVKYVNYAVKISDAALSVCFEKLKETLADTAMNFGEKECRIYSIVYDIFANLSNHSTADCRRITRPDIDEILKFIDANISDNITLDMLAKKCHLSKDRFYHIFKEYTGVTPIKYISKQRIQKACELLKNSDMSVQEIACECNFCTSSYFSKKFTEYMHVTPKKYRKDIRSYERISLHT